MVISRKLRLTVSELLKPIIVEHIEGLMKENNKRIHRTTPSDFLKEKGVRLPKIPESNSKEEVVNRISPEISPVLKYPGTSRSARCPCGSGLKHKRCCGVNA